MVEHSSDEIADVVHSIHQMRSGTKSYSALRFVNNNLYPDLRENSFKILITMTDGDASEDKDIEAIQQARSNFNMMIAAGVGEKVNNDTLEDFSSSQDYIINVNNFVELKSTISSIVENTCSGIDAILSGMEEPGDTTAAPTTTSAAPSSSTTLAPGCYKAFGGLAFVLDGSASVGETGFAELQRFLLELIKEIPNIGNDGVQVAIIQYNNQPRVEINFEDYSNKKDLLDAITFIEYLDGNTRTGAALETLSGLFVEAARPDRKKVGVVITDGRSQDDVTGPSEQLREDGVSLFAVGVGEAEYVELREIASQPTDRYILSVNNYASITQIREELLSKICSAAEGLYISAEESEAGIEDDLLIPDRKLLTTPAFSREVDETSGEMEFTL
ncbi:unnamed protein product [Clavelina lepadiformis]|uniref:VWFA domain-containing protein n=1 Tax=Clavelina lepadiformis TaxID=159417 RepID=A0ABP0H180_CLALP